MGFLFVDMMLIIVEHVIFFLCAIGFFECHFEPMGWGWWLSDIFQFRAVHLPG